MNKRIWIELPKEKWKRNMLARRERRWMRKLTTKTSDINLLDLMLAQWEQLNDQR